ncbi:MAG: hypothetical protein OEY05_02245 [Paracoccaceae bacterium]|nr:hypothetical protein [Paracoccaceae bacterium]
MPVLFEKSAAALARAKIFSAAIVLLAMAAFGSIFVLLEDLPTVVSIVAAGAMVIGALVFLRIVKEAGDILKNGKPWRVEITDTKLIWGSPVATIMEPFEVYLNDIRVTRRIFVTQKNSKVSPKNKYFIDLHDGTSIEVSDQLSAIEPRKVFKALETQGIEYQETTSRQGGKFTVISGT